MQNLLIDAGKHQALRELFPDLDKEILWAVLAAHQGNVDAAASELLGGGGGAPAPVPAAPLPARRPPSPVRPAKPAAPSDFKVLQMVTEMPFSRSSRDIAGKYGLDIQLVAWEDNARYENSSWGPCISDMTLQVEGSMMPIIRSPNFTDLTWDVPVEKINLVVGNEVGGPLYKVLLRFVLYSVQLRDDYSSRSHCETTCRIFGCTCTTLPLGVARPRACSRAATRTPSTLHRLASCPSGRTLYVLVYSQHHLCAVVLTALLL